MISGAMHIAETSGTRRRAASHGAAKTSLTQKILILDDDRLVAQTLAAQVAAEGHVPFVTLDRDAFFQSLAHHDPDILIIDICMPGHDGVDIIRELGDTCAAQVIVTSGMGRRMIETVLRSAEHYGLNVLGALPKPVRRSAIQELLARAETHGSVRSGSPDGADRTNVGADVCKALEQGQFESFFQPKLCLHTDTICGFEALVRWRHPNFGIILPQMFLPQIMTQGLEARLTSAVLDQACRFLRGLKNRAPRVAVNVSAATISDPAFRRTLDSTVARYGLTPDRLIIEVTEVGPEALPQDAVEALVRMRMAGYVLSIDDFGTGVSSLQRLVSVPFSELKIDRSFVRGVARSQETREVIHNLTRLALSLEMFTTVEGVEDESALACLRDLGCDVAQGYHIARPMPAAAATQVYGSRSSG